MGIFITYLIVFLLGATPFIEVVGIVPIAAAAGLPVFLVAVVGFLGNALTIWLIILMADHVRAWWERRREKKGKEEPAKRQKRAAKTWNKYGVPGLSFLSPLIIGSHLGAILAIGFGAGKRQIAMWMTMSLLFWSVTIGIVSYFGMDYILQKTGYEGFLSNLLERE